MSDTIQGIREYFQGTGVCQQLHKLKESAKDEEKKIVDRMFIHYMNNLMSKSEERRLSNSSSSETESTATSPSFQQGNETSLGDAQDATPVQIPILDQHGRSDGRLYEYIRTPDGRAKCCHDDCRRAQKPSSLQTLKCHALKCHNIRLDVKRRKAVLSESIKCSICNKAFVRQQTLTLHVKNMHKRAACLSLPHDGESQQYNNEENVSDLVQLIVDKDLNSLQLQDFLNNQ